MNEYKTNYFFLLGRNPSLSLAEIKSVLGINPKIIVENYAVFSCAENLDQSFLDRLGGTQKIAREISYEKILEKFSEHESKIIFGLSQFPGKKNLKAELIKLKKDLRKKGLKARFVNKNFTNLSNEVFYREKLKEKGGEIILFQGKYYLVEAVQNIFSYSKRDYEKPSRNTKRGLLPPKLAQIMINLLGKKSSIYDPFCGDGVILMEAALMNLNAYGSDINGRAIQDAQANLNWISEYFKTKNLQENVFLRDATLRLNQKLKIDGIVTEGFLGPPQDKLPKREQREKIFSNLKKIYLGFLKSSKEFLRPEQEIILIFPFFNLSNKKEGSKRKNKFTMKSENYPSGHYLLGALSREINDLGYQIFDFQKWSYLNSDTIKHGSSTLIYSRKDQVVCREIVKLVVRVLEKINVPKFY